MGEKESPSEIEAAAELFKSLRDKDTPIGKTFGEIVEDGLVLRAHDIADQLDKRQYQPPPEDDSFKPLRPLAERLAAEIQEKKKGGK